MLHHDTFSPSAGFSSASPHIKNQIPPTPDHVAEILDKVYVKNKLLEKKYIEIMKKFYNISKMITHREIKEIKGSDFEKYYLEADDFVRRMKKLIERGRY